MNDLIVDGQPFETPIAAADQGYAETAPSFGAGFAARIGNLSSLNLTAPQSLSGFVAESEYQPSGLGAIIGRALAVAGEPTGLPPALQQQLPSMVPIETPELSAAQANEKYAPIGPDGKPASITDQPMPEGAAQLAGQTKAAQIERDGVIARFKNAHSWPVDFATGTAAFLMDPLNAATSFMPGFGEEAVAARLGGGFLARMAGRVVAGTTGGALAQAPLTAVRLGISDQEGDDYGLRDAFRDMAFSAAGGAIFHAGLGTIGDLIHGAPRLIDREPTPEMAVVAGAHDTARAIISSDAPAKDAAMRGAIGQLIDGRPVDVASLFPASRADTAIGRFLPAMLDRTPAERTGVDVLARQAEPDLFAEYDRLSSERDALQTRIFSPDDVGAEVDRRAAALRQQAAQAVSRDEWRSLIDQSLDLEDRRPRIVADAVARARDGWSRADEAMRDLAPKVTAAYGTARSQLGLDEAVAGTRNPMLSLSGQPLKPIIDVSRLMADPDAWRTIDLAGVADRQRDLYENGYATGVSDADLRQATDAVYGARPAGVTQEGVIERPTGIAPGEKPGETPNASAEAAEATRASARAVPDHEMAEAEAALPEEARASLAPEDRAELDAADQGLADAQSHAASYKAAALCLQAAE